MQHGEAIVFPTAQATVQDDGKYSKDMSVEVICQTMTRAEALTLTVDVGTCKGWTLEKVEATRPASLKWYLNGYNGDDNILRAGAYILLHGEQIQKASA